MFEWRGLISSSGLTQHQSYKGPGPEQGLAACHENLALDNTDNNRVDYSFFAVYRYFEAMALRAGSSRG